MKKIFDRLKEKYEAQPSFVALQQKEVSLPIYIFDLNPELNSEDILNLCKKYQTDQFKEQKTESVYAWRSDYYTVAKQAMPGFELLFEKVSNKIDKIWQKPYSFLIEHFWFAIYNKGDSSNPHDHSGVDLACVYYASVPENSAPLVITSKKENITIIPKTGMLVIMPGNCEHQVPKSNHEKGERIIVAMNVIRDNFKGFKNSK